MNHTIKTNTVITPILEEALAQGLHVFVPKPRYAEAADFAFVCRELDGPYASVGASSYRFGPAVISIPIKPSRQYGSGVLAAHDGTVADAMRALHHVFNSENVTVLFSGQPAPVVPNHGRARIDSWPGGGANTFVEMAA